MVDASSPESSNDRQPFLAGSRTEIDWRGTRVTWPTNGVPAALDLAAGSLLDCFDTPLSAIELTSDLMSAAGLDEEVATKVAKESISRFLETGHIALHEGPPSMRWLFYPPANSP